MNMQALSLTTRSSTTHGNPFPTYSASQIKDACYQLVRYDYAFTPIRGPYQGVASIPKWFKQPELLARSFTQNANIKIAVLAELAKRVATLREKLPEAQLLLDNTSVPIPSEFARYDFQPQKINSLFFSLVFRNLVLQVDKFEREFDHIMSNYTHDRWQKIETWLAALVELALHEYGHIAHHNGAITVRPSEQFRHKVSRGRLIRAFDLTEEEIKTLGHVESDLCAEAYRKFTSQKDRLKQAICKNKFWNFNEATIAKNFPHTRLHLFLLAHWSTRAMKFGPYELPKQIERNLIDPLREQRLGEACLYWKLTEYLSNYFDALHFKKSWASQLQTPASIPPRDSLTGLCNPLRELSNASLRP